MQMAKSSHSPRKHRGVSASAAVTRGEGSLIVVIDASHHIDPS